MPKGNPIQWSDLALADMATIAPGDLTALEEWWFEYMPPSLHHYIYTVAVKSPSDLPETQEELEAILDDLGTPERRKKRILLLFAAGSLLFFDGLYYRNQRGQRLQSPRGVSFATSNRMNREAVMQYESFRDGTTTFRQWQGWFARSIIMINLANWLLGSGFDTSEQSIANISQLIREQLEYLRGLVNEIEFGRQLLDGSLLRRMKMYFNSAYSRYVKALFNRLYPKQFTEYRSVLNPAEHCQQCIDEAARDWVPYGALIPIGSRTCMGNCRCHYEFRNTFTNEIYTG